MADKLAIGVDIGGTKIAFALVDRAGTVLATHLLPTLPAEGTEAVFDRVAQGVHHLLSLARQPVAGVGVGTPGHLDPVTGIVRIATNLDWVDAPLKSGVQSRLPGNLPVWVLKDANASALAEMYYGAARGRRDFVYVTIGTGLGGGAVLDGKLLEGPGYAAMEIGHMPFMPNHRLCACGMYGCPETALSGGGMLTVTRERLPQHPQSSLAAHADALTTGAVVEAAHHGDPLALVVVDEMALWLGSVIITLAAILNVSFYAVGGGLGHAIADWLIPATRKTLRERATLDDYRAIEVEEALVTSSAVGAACRVWNALGP